MGSPAVDDLFSALKDTDPDIRFLAAKTLADRKDPRAAKILIGQLKDPNYETQGNAANELFVLGSPFVNDLIVALKDMDPYVQAIVAAVLASTKDPRAVNALLDTIHHQDDKDREIAAGVLGEIKNSPSVVKALIEALHDSDPIVGEGAADGLRHKDSPGVIDALTAALKDTDSDVRKNAADSLSTLGTPGFNALLTALTSMNPVVRASASQPLSESSDPRASVALLATMSRHDVTVIIAVYQYFINRGVPGSEVALIEALEQVTVPATIALLPHDVAYLRELPRIMGETFLNCGNTKLAHFAKNWAITNGYEIMWRSGWPVKWGKNSPPLAPRTKPFLFVECPPTQMITGLYERAELHRPHR